MKKVYLSLAILFAAAFYAKAQNDCLVYFEENDNVEITAIAYYSGDTLIQLYPTSIICRDTCLDQLMDKALLRKAVSIRVFYHLNDKEYAYEYSVQTKLEIDKKYEKVVVKPSANEKKEEINIVPEEEKKKGFASGFMQRWFSQSCFMCGFTSIGLHETEMAGYNTNDVPVFDELFTFTEDIMKNAPELPFVDLTNVRIDVNIDVPSRKYKGIVTTLGLTNRFGPFFLRASTSKSFLNERFVLMQPDNWKNVTKWESALDLILEQASQERRGLDRRVELTWGIDVVSLLLLGNDLKIPMGEHISLKATGELFGGRALDGGYVVIIPDDLSNLDNELVGKIADLIPGSSELEDIFVTWGVRELTPDAFYPLSYKPQKIKGYNIRLELLGEWYGKKQWNDKILKSNIGIFAGYSHSNYKSEANAPIYKNKKLVIGLSAAFNLVKCPK